MLKFQQRQYKHITKPFIVQKLSFVYGDLQRSISWKNRDTGYIISWNYWDVNAMIFIYGGR